MSELPQNLLIQIPMATQMQQEDSSRGEYSTYKPSCLPGFDISQLCCYKKMA